jgi:hypothetical protein
MLSPARARVVGPWMRESAAGAPGSARPGRCRPGRFNGGGRTVGGVAGLADDGAEVVRSGDGLAPVWPGLGPRDWLGLGDGLGAGLVTVGVADGFGAGPLTVALADGLGDGLGAGLVTVGLADGLGDGLATVGLGDGHQCRRRCR